MTDFLSSIVERSFGTATAIRPRVASLFESAGGVDIAPAIRPQPKQEPSLEHVVERHAAVPLRDPRTMVQFDEKTRTHLEPAHGASETPTMPSAPRFSEPREGDASEDRSPRRRDLRSMAPESFGESTPHHWVASVDRAVEPQGVLGRSSAGTVGASRERAPSDHALAAPVASIAAPASATSAIDARHLLIPSRRHVEIGSDLQRLVSAFGSKPRERSDAAHLAAMDKAEPEPNVHVTIGRIEVRATAAPKTAVREAAVSPVMGLDEYLRRQVQRGAR